MHMDVSYTHMDNVYSHSITSVEKWKYVLQRWTATKREIGEEALDCKGIMKADKLMNTITDDSLSYYKVVKELRNVFDRGKFMKFHH